MGGPGNQRIAGGGVLLPESVEAGINEPVPVLGFGVLSLLFSVLPLEQSWTLGFLSYS